MNEPTSFDEQVVLSTIGDRRAVARSYQARLQAWSEKNGRKFTAEAKGDTLELAVMDVIGDFFFGGVSANSIKRELDRHPSAKKIRVLVNSPGGDAFDGIAIRSLLKRHPAHVTVEILGEAASAAAILATAGDRVEMHVGSMMMIHRAWTVAIGNAGDMQAAADDLAKLDEGQLSIFVARSKQEAGKVKKWLDAETLMTAEEAIERGFADGMAVEAEPPAEKKPKKTMAAQEDTLSAAATGATDEQFVAAVVAASSEPQLPKTVPSLDMSDEERVAAEAYIVQCRADARAKELADRRSASPLLRAIGAPPPSLGGMHR
jgi:ATP-dependent Clp protease, protease subunit